MFIKQLVVNLGLGASLLLATAGCNLENAAEVVLPAYTGELVVECYLEAGTVPRLSVVESGEFQPPIPSQPTVTLPTATTPTAGLALPNGVTLQLPIDVTATLTLPSGRVMPLRFAPGIDPVTRKYFTHIGTAPLAMQPGQRFALDVRDTRGRHITGTTGVPTLVRIDSVWHGFNGLSGADQRASFNTRWTDPATTTDYYRLLLSNQQESNDLAADYMVTDQVFNGQTYTAPTTTRFTPGDTMTATLFHIEPAYYSFQQSVREAIRANGNPFAQPARIRSTVQGGIGVFTVLVPHRRTLILN
jgi:hypothetical protein